MAGVLTDIVVIPSGRGLPQTNSFIVQGVIPATAFVPGSKSWLSSVLQAWQLPDPLPVQINLLNPLITAVPVNNPPFSSPGRSPLPGILIQWQPPDPLPTLPTKLPPGIPGFSFDQPPRFRFDLTGILTTWQPPDPQPTLPGKLSPAIPGQSVDNPPRLSRLQSFWVETPHPLPQQTSYLVQPFVSQVAQVAYNLDWLPNVLQAWQQQDPQPTLSNLLNPQLTAVPVNNPPFGLLVTVTEPWVVDYIPQQPQYKIIVPPVVNNPPPFRFDLSGILSSWVPPDPLPVQRGSLSPQLTSVPVNNPPFQYAGRNPWVVNVVLSWQPPDPPPVQRGPLNPSFLAVPVNNPPFSYTGRSPLPGILIQWQPPDPLPWINYRITASWLPKPPPAKDLHDHPFFATFGKMTVH